MAGSGDGLGVGLGVGLGWVVGCSVLGWLGRFGGWVAFQFAVFSFSFFLF